MEVSPPLVGALAESEVIPLKPSGSEFRLSGFMKGEGEGGGGCKPFVRLFGMTGS